MWAAFNSPSMCVCVTVLQSDGADQQTFPQAGAGGKTGAPQHRPACVCEHVEVFAHVYSTAISARLRMQMRRCVNVFFCVRAQLAGCRRWERSRGAFRRETSWLISELRFSLTMRRKKKTFFTCGIWFHPKLSVLIPKMSDFAWEPVLIMVFALESMFGFKTQ